MIHDDVAGPVLRSPTEAIKRERERQDKKWGVQLHSPQRWLAILGEEYGEVCRCVLGQKEGEGMHRYIEELVQVAAVAVAAIESHEKGCDCNMYRKDKICHHTGYKPIFRTEVQHRASGEPADSGGSTEETGPGRNDAAQTG